MLPKVLRKRGKDIEKLTHLSLFTGIGGLDLAAEWAGIEMTFEEAGANFSIAKWIEKNVEENNMEELKKCPFCGGEAEFSIDPEPVIDTKGGNGRIKWFVGAVALQQEYAGH